MQNTYLHASTRTHRALRRLITDEGTLADRLSSALATLAGLPPDDVPPELREEFMAIRATRQEGGVLTSTSPDDGKALALRIVALYTQVALSNAGVRLSP